MTAQSPSDDDYRQSPTKLRRQSSTADPLFPYASQLITKMNKGLRQKLIQLAKKFNENAEDAMIICLTSTMMNLRIQNSNFLTQNVQFSEKIIHKLLLSKLWKGGNGVMLNENIILKVGNVN